ncbi:MAG: ribose 5-phosphate isomerase B [Phycisphaeraceae bacterium]|nr:ribose 5-phosphate isomerase B [Phycisphaeraceae bacterium]
MAGPKTIAMGNDHVAYELKFFLKGLLESGGHKVLNFGCDSADKVDYPDFARSVAGAIGSGQASMGVLICGSGIGISIAANRFSHVRAALVHDALGARLSRQHNDANVLCFGAQVTGRWTARDCLETFISTEFDKAIHRHRVEMLATLRD